ncbi:hypothetical protein KIH87_02960 [Paraneptunicella aestuarii]|uniref:hypothetical protein n=1 Tax=Paraneptunicella aestuarii TaxID=2831148 RepID=UPI001E3A2A2D|nr:hypothetical protein [Paraneptunicella aestuarii]UAA39341.1 hypothetical protein KIH87_02960 [Paraneptunicella aestuarii]
MSSNEASKTTETTEPESAVSESVVEYEEPSLTSEAPVISVSAAESTDNLQDEAAVLDSSKLHFSMPMLVSLALIVTAMIHWNS